jgi:uncharacterized protein YdeI (YjbR/CyaY-like superfamily)
VKTLKVKSRQEWREWLAGHHEYVTEIWLVYSKVKTLIGYEESVEEALCFGWIDSLIKRIDEREYARKFTPRKPDSRWSDLNRKRWAKMKAAGLLTPAGERLAPTEKRSAPPARDVSQVPDVLADALARNAKARAYFEQLAPSYRRLYIGWITAAKTDATRQRRVREAVQKMAAGEKLGLK